MAAPYGPPEIRGLIGQVKTLTVAKLKDVLRENSLALSGVKSELQIRMIAHIEKLSNAGDFVGLARLRNTLYSTNFDFTPPRSYSTSSPALSASPQYSSPAPRYTAPYGNHYNMTSATPLPSLQVTFKESPFYSIIRSLSALAECKAREHIRDTVRLSVALSQDVADQVAREPTMRIMAFCAADNGQLPFSRSDVAFPHQVELKCNGDEVKANLRGLKNKPGSTRPADITALIRKKANYPNTVEMTYALTSKVKLSIQRFFLTVNLVRKKSVEELVASLKKGKLLSKERVIREMTSKAQDADIVATSTVMSLKCPLSTLRIDIACRSTTCLHNQCFDASSYLQLQEQAPTWTCPVCNKPAPFDSLTVDQYVEEILKSTPTSVEQVTIEPDGKWHKHDSSDERVNNHNPTPDDENDDFDEDFVEIPSNHRVSSLRHDSSPFPNSELAARTPPMSSREQSRASSSAPRLSNLSNKRPASAVIDLTLSDDEDEAAAPPPPKIIKRPSMSGTAHLFYPPANLVPTDMQEQPEILPQFHFSMPKPALPNFDTDFFNSNPDLL